MGVIFGTLPFTGKKAQYLLSVNKLFVEQRP
jgi:hypothetical protein